MMNHLTTLLLLFLVLVLTEAKFNKQAVEKQLLDSILAPDKYDASIRPPGENGSSSAPVVDKINIYIRSLSDINDVKMEYSSQITFRQEWKDERLKYDDGRLKYLTLTRPDKIWRPDLFFSNEKSGHFHHIMVPNDLIRIKSDGSVLYSSRISMKLNCPMDLSNYPLDNQVCELKMASYGYTTDDIKFIWKEVNPIQITKNLNLPRFTLNSFKTDYCESTTTTGTYSCVVVQLFFSRETTYHIVQSYISTMAIVLLSWVSFWLNPRATTTRIAIWIAALMAMIIRATSIAATTPAVSYTKAIDVWIGTCMTFIFCVVIELCLVNNAINAEDQVRLMNQLAMDDSNKDKHTMCIDDSGKPAQLRTFTSTPLKWLNKFHSKALRIDAASRFLFPAAFAFFNLVYWLTYLPQRSM